MRDTPYASKKGQNMVEVRISLKTPKRWLVIFSDQYCR